MFDPKRLALEMAMKRLIGKKNQKIVVCHKNCILFCFKYVSFPLCVGVSDGRMFGRHSKFARDLSSCSRG